MSNASNLKNRKYLLVAGSEETRSEWVNAIRKALKGDEVSSSEEVRCFFFFIMAVVMLVYDEC